MKLSCVELRLYEMQRTLKRSKDSFQERGKHLFRDTGDVKTGKLFHLAYGMIIECFKGHREKMDTLKKDF